MNQAPATIGKYRLKRELARGGMGVVWVAQDQLLMRSVALKLIRADGAPDDQARQLFQREAQAVARLQHPNVVAIYDYGVTEEGRPYMVMELLEGETLSMRLERARSMSLAALRPLVAQITAALGAAHVEGIVHRDLKPGNIFLSSRGAETTVKVVDFGLAIFAQAPEDRGVKRFAGTPLYMSPEQVRGDELDQRADLWALGVVIYEALTGQRPFDADNLNELKQKIAYEPFTPASSLAAELTPEIDAFFKRALAKSPQERFPSAQALLDAYCAAIPLQPARATRILVVDDEPDVADLIIQCFDDQIEDEEYAFLFAGNGREALDQLATHTDVDVVVTDLRMPEMDGLTFLEKVGAVAPAVRTIVMSAFGDMGNIRQAMNHGAFDFLTKPVDFDSLEATINKAAQGAKQLQDALRVMEENAVLRMFVNPAVLDRLLPIVALPSNVTGEMLEVSVVAVCAHMPHGLHPQQSIEQLNHTWDMLVAAFYAHGAMVVRFSGDMLILAFQGDGHEQRALSACVAAREQQLSSGLGCGFGVSSGNVMVGHVGAPSRHHFEYSLFGPPVHLAHRIARMSGPGAIAMSESPAQASGADVAPESAGERFLVEGHSVSIYPADAAAADAAATDETVSGVSQDQAVQDMMSTTVAVDMTGTDQRDSK